MFLDLVGSGLVTALSALPHGAALRAGRVVGRASGQLLRHKHRRMCGNLGRAGCSHPEETARLAWAQGGENLFEILWLLGRGTVDPWVKVRVEGSEALDEAAREGHGVLLVSAHLGNWELVPAVVARSGLPVAVVARPLGTRRLERKWLAFRERSGVRTLLRGEAGSGMAAARWLRGKQVLGCMMDRTGLSRRLLVPFLGEAMYVPLGPAELAARAGSAVVLGTAQRLPGGEACVRFRRLPIGPGSTPAAMARVIAQALEEEIRRRPEDWLWIYRRQAYLNRAEAPEHLPG
ncbi:MAG TPA: lysophospholipid acyltransferase family protein [Candidatus Polarisedimenticolaceae bacterium]|nr:lysophospholipid acyltransferase family protein [Candidatus Polarisedimenticolaceae bacterium]